MKSLLYFFIITYPFLIYPWGFDPYYTNSKSIYLIAFTCSLWIVFLIKYVRKTIIIESRLINSDYFLFAYVFLTSVSTLFSVDQSLSLTGEINRLEGLSAWLSYFTLYFFTSRFFDMKQLHKILGYHLITSTVVAIYGILQHHLLDFLPRAFSKTNYTRSYAFFDNPNFYGSYLVITISLSLTYLFISKNIYKTVLSLIAVNIQLVSLIYSMTRSAWIGIFFVILFLGIFLFIKQKDLVKRYLIVSMTFFLTFSVINSLEENTYVSRGNTIIQDGGKLISGDVSDKLGSSRMYIWKNALPLIDDYFWIGSGPDTFAVVFPHRDEELKQIFGNGTIIVDKAHNEYLQIAITIGVPALVFYMLFISSLFIRSMKVANRASQKQQVMIIGLLLAAIGYMIQAFFNISVITVAPYFWIVLGLLYRFNTQLKHK